MRILIVNSLYPTSLHPKVVGGAERSVRNLAEALVGAAHQVLVVRAAAPGAAPTEEVFNGVRVHALPINNVYWPFSGEQHSSLSRLLWHVLDDWAPPPSRIADLIEKFQPDVLHTNNLTALGTGVWVVAKRHGIRIVHTLRDYSLLCPRTKLFKDGRMCEALCSDCALLTFRRRSRTSLVDAVVGNSIATLNLHLKHGLFGSAITRTAIGSLPDAGAVPLAPRERRDDPRLVFGYIGRVSDDKGVDLLAAAFGRLPGDRVRLKIAGESAPDIQSRLQKTAGVNTIEFLGFVTPRSFYEEIDVVVAPSLWPEPLPRSVIDAISYGRPVIASDRGGNVEAMGEPPFGSVFDPSRVENLIKAMESFSPIPPLPQPPKKKSPLDMYLKVYSEDV